MEKNQTVRMMSAGQMKDLASAIVQAIPTDLTFDEAKHYIGKKKPLIAEVRKIFSRVDPTDKLPVSLSDWQNFYSDVFGIETDFSNLAIPEKCDGFDRFLIIAEGMTPQKIYDKCAETFPSWKWTDSNLDEIVTSDRTCQNGSYVVWIRDRVEADEELKNLSANQLKKRKISGITLEERLIYELKYFKETGKHLDIQNVTLCAGSRFRDGNVPGVDFNSSDGRVFVSRYHPDGRYGGIRSRQAVSA